MVGTVADARWLSPFRAKPCMAAWKADLSDAAVPEKSIDMPVAETLLTVSPCAVSQPVTASMSDCAGP